VVTTTTRTTTTASASSSAKKDDDTKKRWNNKMTTKRYNSYNVFFMLERQLLLHSRGGGVVGNATTTKATRRDPVDLSTLSPDVQLYVNLDLPPLCRRYADLPLSHDNWFVEMLSGRDHKRVHKRSHGLVPFGDMARIVARNHKEADDETRGFLNEVAERLALFCAGLEAEEGRKARRLETEAENETDGGALGGGDSQSIAIQGSSLVDQYKFKTTHKDMLKSAPVKAPTSMGTTRYAGSESDANIDWLREIHQPTSPEVFNELYERAINHFKPPPPLPFSYDADVERLKRDLALAESAKIETERRIRILKDQIENVHQARQLNQLQQQRQQEQHGRSLLELWQGQHQQRKQHHDHLIRQGVEYYHDHRLRHYSSSLQQHHTTSSGHPTSILPPKKRVRSSGPDDDDIKSAAASTAIGEVVHYPASSFSSVVSSSTRSTMATLSGFFSTAACKLPVQLDTPLISSKATNSLQHRGKWGGDHRGIRW
jgi:hypothetical protein